MTRLRLGIDVGGTNTDAVVVDDAGAVLASKKVVTTPDPMDGIRASLEGVIPDVDKSAISQAMLGTTHPANAIIQRSGLDRIGILHFHAIVQQEPGDWDPLCILEIRRQGRQASDQHVVFVADYHGTCARGAAACTYITSRSQRLRIARKRGNRCRANSCVMD